MAFCECCTCEDVIEFGIVDNDPPCRFFSVGLNFVNAGYVGNACLDTKQEQLNVIGAAFWLYALNVGVDDWRMDQMMATPAPKYTSTLENTFVDSWCYMIIATEDDATFPCETYHKLQEYFKDCCKVGEIGTCHAPTWIGSIYVLKEFTTDAADTHAWVRGPGNPGATLAPSLAAPNEWYSCGSSDCNACWDDETYSYWFINDDTFPQTGNQYTYWTDTGVYLLNDRVIFDESVWRVAVATPIGWANRPGANPGDWVKLS